MDQYSQLSSPRKRKTLFSFFFSVPWTPNTKHRALGCWELGLDLLHLPWLTKPLTGKKGSPITRIYLLDPRGVDGLHGLVDF